MTDDRMALLELIEKDVDGDLVREMLAFAAERPMELEIAAGLAAGSAALQADALDFFADAANCGISLFVLGLGLRWRAGAALAKGCSMGLFGLWVIGVVVWGLATGERPIGRRWALSALRRWPPMSPA